MAHRSRKKQGSRQRYKRPAIWTGAVLLVAVAAWLMVRMATPGSGDLGGASGSESGDPVNPEDFAQDLTVAESDWIKGNEDAEITIIEYGDFQCPACGQYYPLVNELVNEFGDDIRFVYRHFPLSNHEFAEVAARAAEAAGRQDAFWEMHDIIFENQQRWTTRGEGEDDFVEMAGLIGLDTGQFRQDMQSEPVRRKVEQDFQTGMDQGVNAVPTFFINGDRIQNPNSYQEFRQIIEDYEEQVYGED